MKHFFIMFLTLFILGCSSSGGGNSDNTPSTQPKGDSPVDSPVELPEQPPVIVPPSTTTQLPLLVIQVEFNDIQFVSPTSSWQKKIFGKESSELNHYYLEISQDSFLFIPANENADSVNDGFIKVHVNQNHIQTLGADFNKYPEFVNILAEALFLADPSINFANYDANENKKIDVNELQIMFLVAGGEEASGANPGIWAHQSCINGLVLDNISLMQCDNGSYTAFGERHFSINGPDASIGIIAHELGHGVFYLPDLYDRDLSSEGIGNFGLMGAGSWGFQQGELPGNTPVPMSAWSKAKVGFTTPQLITSTTPNLSLEATGTKNYQSFRLNTQDPNEYFLIENRSSLGYDSGLYILNETIFQGGLAIWHVDENQSHNDNENRKLLDLEEADGFHLDTAGNQGNQSNLFHSGNNQFTTESSPANSHLYNGNSSGINIRNISVPGSTMFLDLEI